MILNLMNTVKKNLRSNSPAKSFTLFFKISGFWKDAFKCITGLILFTPKMSVKQDLLKIIEKT